MTQILEQAWNKVIKLPEDRQDLIAYMILDEIQDDTFWDVRFLNSQDQLSSIAEKVRNDIKAGRIQKKGFGDL